jgi:hypothetical protein
MFSPIVSIVPVNLCAEKTLSSDEQFTTEGLVFRRSAGSCKLVRLEKFIGNFPNLGVIVFQKLALGFPKGISQGTTDCLSFIVADTSPSV